MADYRVVYTMVDGTNITQEIRNKVGGLRDLVNDLTRNAYTTHIPSKEDGAFIINKHNVLYMEVKEI